jgi:hypothetical protein
MGCDIHAIVEYEKWGSYSSLTRGQLNIPRDYDLFTVLALGPGGITDDLPYPPRGLPDGLSFDAREYYYMPASEVEQFMAEHYTPEEEEEGFDPEEYAGYAGEASRQVFHESGLLPAPELYAHSWLNLPELKEVLAYGHLSKDRLSPEFCAVLAAMEELAERYGDEKVRLVFCFDGAG